MKKEWTTREKVLAGLSVAAIVVGGVALYNTRETNRALTNGLNRIKGGINVDISDVLVDKAMKEAVKDEAKRVATNASTRITNHVEKDISEQIATLIHPVEKEIKEMAVKNYKKIVSDSEKEIIAGIKEGVVDGVLECVDIPELVEEVTSGAKKKLIKKLVKEMAS